MVEAVVAVQHQHQAGRVEIVNNFREIRNVAKNDRDEFGMLSDHLNRMSAELGRRMDRLQGDHSRLSTVLEGMGEGVITVNDAEKILFANPAAGKLLNFDPLESVGRPLVEAVRNHTLHEAVLETISGQNNGSQELEIGENHCAVVQHR